MKLTITTTEAKALAYRAFNDVSPVAIASKDDIVIVSDVTTNTPAIEISRMLVIVRNCGDYKTGNKIQAIKLLLEHCASCGFFVSLSDAKSFVENL